MNDDGDNGRIDRDGRGRFVRGNRCAEGKKGNATRQRLIQSFRNASSESDMEKLYKKMLKMALAGNVKVIELLLLFLTGRPEPAEQTGLDLSEYSPDETFL